MAFMVALLAKETALVFLPLMLLTDWFLRRKLIGFWLLTTVMALLFLTWRYLLTQSHLLGDILTNPMELGLRLLHIPTALMIDMRSVLWPGDLHYYSTLDILSPWWPWWLLMGAIIILLKVLAPNDTAERRMLWLGIGIFIACLLPVLNIVPLVNEYSFILLADHFLYMPLIGLLISLGSLFRQWLLPPRRVIVLIITGLLAIMLTFYQNTFWQSEVALFERTVQFEPRFGRGHALLAKAYYFNKRYQKSLEHYAKAQAIFETYAIKVQDPKARGFYLGFLKGIHFDQAQAYLALGKLQSAEIAYIQALNLDPIDNVVKNNLATVLLPCASWLESFCKVATLIASSPIS